MASTVADNVGTKAAPLSANPSRKRLRLRAQVPMIASDYTYCIINVAATGAIAEIHERLPLMLEVDWALWLGETPGRCDASSPLAAR
jgi:putative SOS response-associated peptidase YedK